MKKFTLFTLLCLSVSLIHAQSVDDVKKYLILGQFKDGKTELDKAMGNAKFSGKAEAWLMKMAIYGVLAIDDKEKNEALKDQYASDAYKAFKKYMELEPALILMTSPEYKDFPVYLYNAFTISGYNDYTKDKWEPAFDKFKIASTLSDLLIDKKIMVTNFDTTVVYLAGITAQNSKNTEEAINFYKRLADIKIPGEDYENLYKFLVFNYFIKKDFANFEKYKAIGASLYPKTEYFTFDKLDFAYDLATSFDERLKMLEEVLAAEPNNSKGTLLLAEILYDTLHSTRDGAVPPANAAELETRMIALFNKASTLDPNDIMPYLFLGEHLYLKAQEVNDARSAHAKAMQARTKPGAKASAEDVAKRDQLDKQYLQAMANAKDPLEKAGEIFASKTLTDIREKQQYKKIANDLSEIYGYMKVMAKGKPADQAKYAEQEKKWNERYDSIK